MVVNLLAGSLAGAWVAADWATRMHSRTLHRVLAFLLVLIAVVLAATHYADVGGLDLDAVPRTVAGVIAGVGIGMVAAFMGVAGGELLIPTIVLLFGIDIRLAGSLSLLVSLPTMLIACSARSASSFLSFRSAAFGVPAVTFQGRSVFARECQPALSRKRVSDPHSSHTVAIRITPH